MVTERYDYINIREVISRCTRHPMLKNIDLETCIQYVIDFIRIVGMPTLYNDSIDEVHIENYRGILPCDIVSIVQVKNKRTGICMRSITDSFIPALNKNIHEKDFKVHHHRHTDMPHHHPMDSHSHFNSEHHLHHEGHFHHKEGHHPHHQGDPAKVIDRNIAMQMDMFKSVIVENANNEETFKTQGRYIFTSFKEGDVIIAYKSLPVDDEGLPLLIDNSVFLRALELYIKKQVFTMLFDMRKINSNVLTNTQQEYAFAVAQCEKEFIMPSISEMESISRMWTSIIPRVTEFDRGFKGLGDRTYIKDN